MKGGPIAALALAAAGCVPAAPPKDLAAARSVLARVESCAFAGLAEDAIRDAEAALAEAERQADADPGGYDAADSAYVALRAAERAKVVATYGADVEALAKARRMVARLEEIQARRAAEAAEVARRRAAAQEAREAFWAAHRAAVARARSSADGIVELAHAMVLQMPDAELFLPGTSYLRPEAVARLAAFARALPRSPRGLIRVTVLVDHPTAHLDAERLTERRRQHVIEVLRASGVPEAALLPAARHPQTGSEVHIEVTEPPAIAGDE
jgi:outer membrane protein OmpA-like peptidoglycan-associated protein